MKREFESGTSLAETLLAVALLGILATVALKGLSLYTGTSSDTVVRGKVLDSRVYLFDRISCEKTLAPLVAAGQCDGKQYVAVKDANDAAMISSDSQSKLGPFRLRAQCADLGGFYGISTEYLRTDAKGNPARDLLANKTTDWKAVSAVPIVCAPNSQILKWRAVATYAFTLSSIKVVFLTFKGNSYRVSLNDFISNIRIDWSSSLAILSISGFPKNLIPKNLIDLTYKQSESFLHPIVSRLDQKTLWKFFGRYSNSIFSVSTQLNLLNEFLMSSHEMHGNNVVATSDERKIARKETHRVKFIGDLDKDGQPDNAELDGFANYGGPFDTLTAKKNGTITGINKGSTWGNDEYFMGLSSEEILYVKSGGN